MAHAFLVTMGGFQFYFSKDEADEANKVKSSIKGRKANKPYPLSPKNAIELVRRGHLVAPTDAELASLSKGDAFSKTVIIVQSLWFVMQIIARPINHLSVTSLEVMTLGYTLMTIMLYVVWWQKPLNVGCAIRIPNEHVEPKDKLDGDLMERICNHLIGVPDRFIDLSEHKGVPVFHAGDPEWVDAVRGDFIVAPVAMAFGGIHFIAWNYQFPSNIEQQLWRWSAIAITAAPLAVALFALCVPQMWKILFHGETTWEIPRQQRMIQMAGYFMAPLSVIYLAGRLITITIAFTALRALPFAAYQTVNWTTFVPHV